MAFEASSIIGDVSAKTSRGVATGAAAATRFANAWAAPAETAGRQQGQAGAWARI
ncbi:hypothetical protein [Nitratireductor sp. StC3]|uniref:hypothetical protein n=1 Tax=Nitratireductor sp. StC3 TaxID=2126741 RepID=UPI001304D3C7|nr:hypothetical protein [Nitratireductor sp. StC3]